MANPLCRAAINQRVSGDPNVWPLTALGVFAARPLRRALSLGCGTGSLERTAMRLKMFGEIDAMDSSEASLHVARERASEEGLERVRRMYHELPPEWRRWPELRDPIEHNDPSEAVRSSAILPAVRRLFEVLVERPYGGHIVPILMSQVALDKIPPAALDGLVTG